MRRKIYLVLLCVIIVFFTGCGGSKKTMLNNSTPEETVECYLEQTLKDDTDSMRLLLTPKLVENNGVGLYGKHTGKIIDMHIYKLERTKKFGQFISDDQKKLPLEYATVNAVFDASFQIAIFYKMTTEEWNLLFSLQRDTTKKEDGWFIYSIGPTYIG